MCDSRRPLNGADSEELIMEPKTDPIPSDIAEDQLRAYQLLTYPVWPTRAANEGWDSPEVPPSARALVGAGARGGE